MKNSKEFAHEDVYKIGYRWIGRSTSKDFINWTKVEPMDVGDAPVKEFYHNQTHPYFRAPPTSTLPCPYDSWEHP